jgi:hypothetical protein
MADFRIYNGVNSGELQGSASALQLPDIPCQMVMFVALNDNAGDVYLGGEGVTVADGTTDTTTGIELKASAATGWIFISNLNLLYRICDNTGDDITYLALG